MFPSDASLSLMYGLCQKNDDCERGTNHDGECGPCVCKVKHEGSCLVAREKALAAYDKVIEGYRS